MPTKILRKEKGDRTIIKEEQIEKQRNVKTNQEEELCKIWQTFKIYLMNLSQILQTFSDQGLMCRVT